MEPVARMEFDRRISLPAHALFVGASMSGKTRLTTKLLSTPQLFNPPPKTILFYYDQFQPQYLELKKRLAGLGTDMQLHRGHDVNLDDLPHNDHQTILLIDDASEGSAASKEVARIATNGRHKNISLWLIWHSLFTKHPSSRIISQNMSLYFFLPSPRLESQLRTFGAQLGMQQRLLAAYRSCVDSDPRAEHRYLLVDLSSSNVPNILRLRSHIHEAVQYCYA
jgi:hypothetical protein